MESLIHHLSDLTWTLAPVAYCFLVISAVTKRGALLAAARAGWRDTRTNIGLFAINYVLFIPIVAVPILTVFALVPNWHELADEWPATPFWMKVLLAIALIDVTAYWRHRFEHSSFMWRFHATHHADESLNWFSVTRKHPVGKLFEVMVDIVPALMIGSPLVVILVAQTIRGWWGYLIHADVPWTLGPLGAVLISPAAHRLHHIRDETLMGANYANTFSLWDRVFGTWVDPTPHIGCATGIAEGTRGILGELARPWKMGPVEDADHGEAAAYAALYRAPGQRIERALEDDRGGMTVDHRAPFPPAGILRDELALCTPGGPAFVPQQHRTFELGDEVACVGSAGLGARPLTAVHVAGQSDHYAGDGPRRGKLGEDVGIGPELAACQGLARRGEAPARVGQGDTDGLCPEVETKQRAAAG